MWAKDLFAKTPLCQYGAVLKGMPPGVLFNRRLILTALLYATSAVPLTWDQGSAATIPSLPGFQQYFGIDSGTDAGAIQNFVSLVVLGQALGAALSFFINDKIGRLWSLRVYFMVYIVGQLISLSAPNLGALYTGRVIAGVGIGALTVTGPMSLAEIAPAEVRGLLVAWFAVSMGLAHFCAVFCTYGIRLHLESGSLQFQIVMLVPCIYLSLWIAASFFLSESPRWLSLAGKSDQAINALCSIRGLPADHPRIRSEIEDSRSESRHEAHESGHSLLFILRETFTHRSNIRRLQQCLVCYALPQLSGASSVSSYFVPILELIGVGGGSDHKLFLTGMYTMSRFFYALITSFFLIDLLGRRRSLFLGCFLQAAGDLYIAIFLKISSGGHNVSESASQAAVAMIFIHSFGYSAGLLTLPYVFGAELWPDNIRSFGAALGQTFHWLFSYAMHYALPSLLDATNNWGAFVFFATWCCVAIGYVFFVVPEVTGLSAEQIEDVFRSPWYSAYRTMKHIKPGSIGGNDADSKKDVEEIETNERWVITH